MLKDRMKAAQRIAHDLHAAENAIDEAIVKIARLAATLPTARIETNMSAIVGQDAVGKVTQAIAAAGSVRQMLTEAHIALGETQKQVGLGARMFGDGVNKPKGSNSHNTILANDIESDKQTLSQAAAG
jgi:hypothetical protein